MPLEIRELIIRATVEGKNNSTATTGEQESSGAKDINAIADKVFEILREKSER